MRLNILTMGYISCYTGITKPPAPAILPSTEGGQQGGSLFFVINFFVTLKQ